MFKFSKLNWATFITFVVGIICVMFNNVWTPMIIPALVLFAGGFCLLSISLYFAAKNKEDKLALIKEELLMELAVTEDGEEYVVKNNPTTKKYRRKMRRERLNNYIPMIFCIIVSVAMVALLIKFIVAL